MDITVHIVAPELAAAITAVATAMKTKEFTVSAPSLAEEHPVQNPFPAPNPTAAVPVMQAPPQPVVPVVPTAPPPVAAPAAAPVPQVVPTTAPAYNLDQLCAAAAAFADQSDANRGQVVALIQKYGVRALNEIPVAQFGSFALELRQMGATI